MHRQASARIGAEARQPAGGSIADRHHCAAFATGDDFPIEACMGIGPFATLHFSAPRPACLGAKLSRPASAGRSGKGRAAFNADGPAVMLGRRLERDCKQFTIFRRFHWLMPLNSLILLHYLYSILDLSRLNPCGRKKLGLTRKISEWEGRGSGRWRVSDFLPPPPQGGVTSMSHQ